MNADQISKLFEVMRLTFVDGIVDEVPSESEVLDEPLATLTLIDDAAGFGLAVKLNPQVPLLTPITEGDPV